MTLDELLTAVGWSTDELAYRLGVRPDSVAKWCSGRRHPPQAVLDWLAHIAECQARAGPAPAGWLENGQGQGTRL